jgi:thymidylate synthase
MISLTAPTANELYAQACHAVLAHGRDVRPRGMPTTEILGAHLCLTSPRHRFVDLPPARVINPAFAVAETLWILSGSDDPWIFDYNRNLARYADDGRLQGAYGPRMRRWRDGLDQLDNVRQLLTRDPDSRQAVIQLFDPERDTRGHRDVPCTLGYRFFIRDGRLHMHTTMRSQDLWLGFPYDVFAATVLQELLAGWLDVELGEYHHFVDSLHLYEQHTNTAATIDPASTSPSEPLEPLAVPWSDFTTLLDDVIAGQDPATAPTSTWSSFAAVMAGYRSWTVGDRPLALATAATTPGPLGAALERWYERLALQAPVAVTSEANR